MLKKHPRALAFIFFTEMWERVGFYTLMAILVLYMDKVLGWSDARKGDSYGIFLALCYFVPLLGGWLGDKIIGQIRTVRAGAFLMALGYVGLALSGPGRRELRQRTSRKILQPSPPRPVLPVSRGAHAPGRGSGRDLPQEAQALCRVMAGGQA